MLLHFSHKGKIINNSSENLCFGSLKSFNYDILKYPLEWVIAVFSILVRNQSWLQSENCLFDYAWYEHVDIMLCIIND